MWLICTCIFPHCTLSISLYAYVLLSSSICPYIYTYLIQFMCTCIYSMHLRLHSLNIIITIFSLDSMYKTHVHSSYNTRTCNHKQLINDFFLNTKTNKTHMHSHFLHQMRQMNLVLTSVTYMHSLAEHICTFTHRLFLINKLA